MNPNIPRPQVVSVAFRQLQNRLNGVRKGINSAAAKEMRSGKYDDAQKWIEIGRTVAEYAQRVDAFAQEWKRLVRAARIVARSKEGEPLKAASAPMSTRRTPVWKYCEPALKALVARGGTAAMGEILSDLQSVVAEELTDTDRAPVGKRSVPRWHDEVQRAYRQCQREGWIEKEKRRDGVWRVTPKGKAIAEAKP